MRRHHSTEPGAARARIEEASRRGRISGLKDNVTRNALPFGVVSGIEVSRQRAVRSTYHRPATQGTVQSSPAQVNAEKPRSQVGLDYEVCARIPAVCLYMKQPCRVLRTVTFGTHTSLKECGKGPPNHSAPDTNTGVREMVTDRQ